MLLILLPLVLGDAAYDAWFDAAKSADGEYVLPSANHAGYGNAAGLPVAFQRCGVKVGVGTYEAGVTSSWETCSVGDRKKQKDVTCNNYFVKSVDMKAFVACQGKHYVSGGMDGRRNGRSYKCVTSPNKIGDSIVTKSINLCVAEKEGFIAETLTKKLHQAQTECKAQLCQYAESGKWNVHSLDLYNRKAKLAEAAKYETPWPKSIAGMMNGRWGWRHTARQACGTTYLGFTLINVETLWGDLVDKNNNFNKLTCPGFAENALVLDDEAAYLAQEAVAYLPQEDREELELVTTDPADIGIATKIGRDGNVELDEDHQFESVDVNAAGVSTDEDEGFPIIDPPNDDDDSSTVRTGLLANQVVASDGVSVRRSSQS